MAPLVLFAVALAVRAAVGALHIDPAYPDSFYYVNVARALADGQGFTIDYVWSFLDVGGELPASPTLPIPSNAHWMPLAALVQVPFIWLLGPTPLASVLPFWLAGAACAPLAYLIGRDFGIGRGTSLTAGLLVAVPAAVTPFIAQPDNFGLFMLLGGLALWLAVRAGRGERWAFVAGGLVVGLAMLARNDGALLGVPFALVALRGVMQPATRRRAFVSGAACLGVFLAVIGPWLLRQMLVFGSFSPSASSGRALWITDYRELWSAGPAPTLESLLAGGIGPLLASRAEGLAAALGVFALQPLAIVLVPFALVGAWQRRRDPAFAPFFIYGALLLSVCVLLVPAHIAHGMFLHSAVALLPHTFLLVGVGVAHVVEWVAARRPTWQPAQARPVFQAGLVVVVALVAVVQTLDVAHAWRANAAARESVAATLATIPASDRVMSADPGAYRYLFGAVGVVSPDDPLELVERTAREYGVRWLVLERTAIVPALAPVLAAGERPAWLSRPLAWAPGQPVASRTDAHEGGMAPVAARDPAPAAPALAVYAVCFSPGDRRCSP